ncbi:hypothetical protein EB796_016465 [Bugula neritina]|uniref:Uncharacterized protein n=1 Tax=Bugula neritina TaxID=10212 RepID=A0A7J7JG02_BUGNE|nr:hypothetical protein EB796_016465 [Bugula neritina]
MNSTTMICVEVFEVMASEDPAISKKLKDWIKTTNEILLNDNNLDVADADAEQKELLSLSTSLFELFKKGLSPQLIGEVCQQLITLFRSKKRNLHLLVLEFIPLLIWSYLSTTQSSSTKVMAATVTKSWHDAVMYIP